MAAKQIEQLHLARRACNGLAGKADAVTLGLNLKRTKLKSGQRLLARHTGSRICAAKNGLDAGDDLARGEGLDDIIVCAHLKAEDAVDLLAAGGEHDDG